MPKPPLDPALRGRTGPGSERENLSRRQQRKRDKERRKAFYKWWGARRDSEA